MYSSIKLKSMVLLLSLFLLGSMNADDSTATKEKPAVTENNGKPEIETDAAPEEKNSDNVETEKKDADAKDESKSDESTKTDVSESDSDDASKGKDAKENASKDDSKKDDAKKDDAKSDNAKESSKKVATKKEEEKEESKTNVRLLALSGSYVDRVESAGIDAMSLLAGRGAVAQKPFYRLCDYVDEMAKEEDLKFVVFDLSTDSLSLNLAQLDELTRRIEKLRAAGKKTKAWLESASSVHMTIAAACDEVYLADFGSVDLSSVALSSMYYRDAMDLVGVKASVIRAGDFKGAVEPYTVPQMSDHLREHYTDMLTHMNNARVSCISKGRGLQTSDVRKLQKQRFLTPQEALANGLVDHLAPYGSMKETINNAIGEPTEWTAPTKAKKKEMSVFEIMSMMMSGPKSSSRNRLKSDTVAVLHLSGAIVDGKSGSSGIVSGTAVKEIQKLIDEDKIKAVVVRINSPGGSATASESIRQALVKLAKAKPTIISMGRVAASGGYWISCIDQPIYAERGTITGSIGVFSMKLSFGTLMRRVGVSLESITLDDSAAAFSMDRQWTDGDVSNIQKSIDMVYDKFLKLAGESRDMPREKIEPLAGGRVWSGEQAKEVGLVDEIGGLDDCLIVAAKKAKLDDYEIVHRPEQKTGLSLLDLMGGDSDSDEIFEQLAASPAFKLLARKGISMDVMKTILRDGIERTEGMPTIWLLDPSEFSIR